MRQTVCTVTPNSFKTEVVIRAVESYGNTEMKGCNFFFFFFFFFLLLWMIYLIFFHIEKLTALKRYVLWNNAGLNLLKNECDYMIVFFVFF